MNFIFALILPALGAAIEMPSDVSAVYTYQCTHTFLEGEGVTPHSVSCPAGQHLGLIEANYTYALFQSLKESNWDQKGKDRNYEQVVCGKVVPEESCGFSAPKLKFGLSRQSEGEFIAAVSLVPNRYSPAEVYGYAAMPDHTGKCPEGLVRIARVIANPLPFWRELLPNNFEGMGNFDLYLSTLDEEIAPYKVYLKMNSSPCDESGDCYNATFGQANLMQTVPYVYENPIACAIPPSAIPAPLRK